jgi:hypothetical protein
LILRVEGGGVEEHQKPGRGNQTGRRGGKEEGSRREKEGVRGEERKKGRRETEGARREGGREGGGREEEGGRGEEHLFVLGSTAKYSNTSSAEGGLSSSIFPWKANTVTNRESEIATGGEEGEGRREGGRGGEEGGGREEGERKHGEGER